MKTCTIAHCFFKDVPNEAFKKILYVAYVCMYMLSDEYEQLFLYFVYIGFVQFVFQDYLQIQCFSTYNN